MERGRKRNLVRIEQPVTVKSSTGALTTTWTIFRTMWVNISNYNIYEKQKSEASWPGADCKISGDYVAGLLPTFRIVYGNKIYSILNIDNVEERNREVIFVCQSGLKAS